MFISIINLNVKYIMNYIELTGNNCSAPNPYFKQFNQEKRLADLL